MEKAAFKEAARAQTSFLAPLEKKKLLWLAARMPASVNSDHLTGLGLLSTIGAGLGYWYASRDPVIGLLFVCAMLVANWFGDSLDGTLARYRNRQRPRYGFYVDHIVDAFGTTFLMGGLALSGFMSPSIAMPLLVVYLILSIESYLTTYTIGKFQISYWKFSPTELRILLCIGNLVLLWRPYAELLGRNFLIFDIGGVVGLIGMVAMLISAVARHTAQLYREERLP
ncbi:MAG: CDP-alcohol phosphatidyltransferase family protein [Acidimicrobiia bacterium]|nr:CDP-alcohol phosphatidyltransferase family protein [Acidimicrobiia bacterium]